MHEHLWNYIKSGWAEDEVLGPLPESTFVKLLRDGSISNKTKVMSPTRSKGSWVEAGEIPSCLKVIEQGVAERREKKEQEAESKRQQNEAKSREKAKLQQKAAEESRRQKEVAEAQRLEAQQRQMIERQQMTPQVIPAPPPAHQRPAVYVQPAGYQQAAVFQDQVPGQSNVYVTTVVVPPKQSNKAVAVLLNIFLLPGLGQLTQGRVAVGLALIFSWIVSIILCFFCIGVVMMPLVWLIAVIEAAVVD